MAEHERKATVTGFTAHPGYQAGYLAAEEERPFAFHYPTVYVSACLVNDEWEFVATYCQGYQAWCVEAGIVEE